MTADITSRVPTLTLNNGVEIPQIGLGVFQVPEDRTQEAVEQAFEAGYRHVDTAAAYRNEAGVGAAIRASGLPREEVFVTTKLRAGDQGRESTRRAFDASREALGLDVVDLYLIHWPRPDLDLYVETWKVLEEIYSEGAVRAIGVSNFLPEHLSTLLAETDVVPAVNQVELHPTFQDPATLRATRDAGTVVEAYSPLGRGKDLDAHAVRSAAEAHGVTPAQAVLRWHLQRGFVIIPKSSRPERMAENIDILGFELSDDEMAAIDALDSDARIGTNPANFTMSQY